MSINPHYMGGNAAQSNPTANQQSGFPGYQGGSGFSNPYAEAVHNGSQNQGQWGGGQWGNQSQGQWGGYQEPPYLADPAAFMDMVTKIQHNLNLSFGDTLRNMPRNPLTEFLMQRMGSINGNIMSVPNAAQILTLVSYSIAKMRTEGYPAQEIINRMMQDIIPVIAVNWMGHSSPLLPRTVDFQTYFNACAGRVRHEVAIGQTVLEQLGKKAERIRAQQGYGNQGGSYWGNPSQGQGNGYWGGNQTNDYSSTLSNPDTRTGYATQQEQTSISLLGEGSMVGTMHLPTIIEEDGTSRSVLSEIASPNPAYQGTSTPTPPVQERASPMDNGFFSAGTGTNSSVMADPKSDPFYSAISIGEDFLREEEKAKAIVANAAKTNTYDNSMDLPLTLDTGYEPRHFHHGAASSGFDNSDEIEYEPSPQERVEELRRQREVRDAMQSPIPTGYQPAGFDHEAIAALDHLNAFEQEELEDLFDEIDNDLPTYSAESPSERARREQAERVEATNTSSYPTVDPATLKAIATGNYKAMENQEYDYHELDTLKRRDVRRRQSNRLKIVPAYLAGHQRLVVVDCGKHTVIRPETAGDRMKYAEHETELLGSTVNNITGDVGDLSIAENALDRALKAQSISEYKEIIDAKIEEGKLDDVETLLSDTPAITIADTLIGERNEDYLTPALTYLHEQLADAGDHDVEQMVINYNLRTVNPILIGKTDIDALGFVTRAKTAASVVKHIQSFNEKTNLPQRTLAKLHDDATQLVNRAIALEFEEEWSITTLTGDFAELAEAVEEEFGEEGVNILNTIYVEAARLVYRAYTHTDLAKEGDKVVAGVDLTEGDEETAVLGTVENITLVPFAYADLPIAFSGDFGIISKQLNAKLYDVLQERIHSVTNPHVGTWKFVTTDNVVYTFCKAIAGTEIFIVRN